MAPLTGPMPAYRSVLGRLFMLQAAWNYERMQGVGFGHAAEPALRSLEGGTGGARYRAALARHSQFFNAHPYLAGLALGASLRAELEGEAPERIERLRAALCGPLGSLGDRLIWASWLPACAAIAVALVAFGARAWAIASFLVLYNVVHLSARVWALSAGWRRGMLVASALSSPLLRTAGSSAAPLTGLLVGMVLPVAFGWQLSGSSPAAFAVATAGALLIAVLVRAARGRASAVTLAALVLGGTGLVGLLWS